MCDFLLKSDASEIKPFGKRWCGPGKYDLGKRTLIAEYAKNKNEEARHVKVFCTAMPARFYEIEVEEGKNSVKDLQKGYKISTSSGEAGIAAIIAEAISGGKLIFEAF